MHLASFYYTSKSEMFIFILVHIFFFSAPTNAVLGGSQVQDAVDSVLFHFLEFAVIWSCV